MRLIKHTTLLVPSGIKPQFGTQRLKREIQKQRDPEFGWWIDVNNVLLNIVNELIN